MSYYHPLQDRWSFSFNSLLGWGGGLGGVCYSREVKMPSFKTFKGRLDETLKAELEETVLPLCPKVAFVKQIWHPENITDPSNSSCPYVLPF